MSANNLHILSKKFWFFILRIGLGIYLLISGMIKIMNGKIAGEYMIKIGETNWWNINFEPLQGFAEREAILSGATPVYWLSDVPEWYMEMLETFIIPFRHVIMYFQTIGTVIIGLMLLTGLFISFSALISLVLAGFILLAGNGFWFSLVIIIISLVLLSGKGRVISLDKWILPGIFNLIKTETRNQKSGD